MPFQPERFEKYRLPVHLAEIEQPFSEIIQHLTNWQQHYVIVEDGTHLLYARLGDLQREITEDELDFKIPIDHLPLKFIPGYLTEKELENRDVSDGLHDDWYETLMAKNDLKHRVIGVYWPEAELDNRKVSDWLRDHPGEPLVTNIAGQFYLFLNPEAGPAGKANKPVFFTAVYPEVLRTAEVNSFYIYAHLAKHLTKLESEAGSNAVETSAKEAQIAPGTMLRLVPEYTPIIEDGQLSDKAVADLKSKVIFDPPYHEIIWHGRCKKVKFDITPSGTLHGFHFQVRVNILVDGVLPISSIDLSFVTKGKGLPDPEHISRQNRQHGTRTYYDVFISYSSDDLALVQKVVETRKKLKDIVFWDRDSIPSGTNWKAVLAEAIENSQVFALYWSSSSAASDHVKDEYEHALKHRMPDIIHRRFLRPFYWEDELPPIPLKLSATRIQFEKIDLNGL